MNAVVFAGPPSRPARLPPSSTPCACRRLPRATCIASRWSGRGRSASSTATSSAARGLAQGDPVGAQPGHSRLRQREHGGACVPPSSRRSAWWAWARSSRRIATVCSKTTTRWPWCTARRTPAIVPGSDAMVNIRATVARARAAGRGRRRRRRRRWCASPRGCYYAERTYARVLESAREEGAAGGRCSSDFRPMAADRARSTRSATTRWRCSRRCARVSTSDAGPAPVDFVFEDRCGGTNCARTPPKPAWRADDARVLEALARDRRGFGSAAVAAALGWQLACEEAGREGATIEAGRLVERASDLCRRLELPRCRGGRSMARRESQHARWARASARSQRRRRSRIGAQGRHPDADAAPVPALDGRLWPAPRSERRRSNHHERDPPPAR